MISTKKQMALECTKAHHNIVKTLVYEEIRGNLLKTCKRYMRLDKETLHNKCLVALAYNLDVMTKSKVCNKKPRKSINDMQAEIDELKALLNELISMR